MKEREELRMRLRGAQRDIVWAAPQLFSLQEVAFGQVGNKDQVADPGDEKAAAKWVVTFIEIRTRKTPKSKFKLFSDIEAANSFVDDLVAGKFVYAREDGQPLPEDEIAYIQGLIDRKAVGADEQYGIDIRVHDLRNVLEIDGIIDVEGKTSLTVKKTLGDERIQELEERFSDLWPIAAQMEFVMRERSVESAPYVAAATRYQLHVEENSRVAGYLLNELEYLARGEERTLLHVLQTGLKAGDGGGKTRAQDMAERVIGLMDEIHRLRFQTKIHFVSSKKRLLEVAYKNLKKENSRLWREGQGQLDDYLDYLKDGEFGEYNQSRYFEVFPNERVEKVNIYQKQPKPLG